MSLLNGLRWTLYFVLFFVVYYLPAEILHRLGFKSRSYEVFQRTFTHVVLRLFAIKVKINGAENFSPQFNYIIIANHLSWFDQFAIVSAFPVHLRFMVKAEYMKIPILNRAFRLYGFVSVNREKPEKDSLNEVYSILERGDSIVIYPEGTRSHDAQLRPFKLGAFRYAAKSGKAILPIVIEGTHSLLSKGRSLLDFKSGTVTLTLLPAQNVTTNEIEVAKVKLEKQFSAQL